MTSKSYITWTQTRNWCMQNPDKLAAIVTPEGIFEVQFKLRKKSEYPVEEDHDWIRKQFVDKTVKDM